MDSKVWDLAALPCLRRAPLLLLATGTGLACCALPHQVALGPRPLATRSHSRIRSRSARGRDSDGEHRYYGTSHTSGLPLPRGDYSFSSPVPPEPPLPGSERGSGG
ncbi:hypothetical protein Landi51_07207 [Colletotrichum acutatum]